MCGANRDTSEDLGHQLLAAAMAAGVDVDRFGGRLGQNGIAFTVGDRRTTDPEQRRKILGRFDGRGPVVVSVSAGRYRRADRDLLRSFAEPFGITVEHGRSGRPRGTPDPKRIADDDRRRIVQRMRREIECAMAGKFRDPVRRASEVVACEVLLSRSTVLAVWRAAPATTDPT